MLIAKRRQGVAPRGVNAHEQSQQIWRSSDVPGYFLRATSEISECPGEDVAAQPLTRTPGVPIHCRVSRLDGRSGKHRKVAGEESPGSMDIRCRITTGGREPRESATESRPPHPASPFSACGEGQARER